MSTIAEDHLPTIRQLSDFKELYNIVLEKVKEFNALSERYYNMES